MDTDFDEFLQAEGEEGSEQGDSEFFPEVPECLNENTEINTSHCILGWQGQKGFSKSSLLSHFSKQAPFQYQGLQAAPAESRDLIAGVRVGSLALNFFTHGRAGLEFESMLSYLDTLFPGEFGELNHSKRFVAAFVATSVKLLKTHQAPAP